jgi:hypothetical protein
MVVVVSSTIVEPSHHDSHLLWFLMTCPSERSTQSNSNNPQLWAMFESQNLSRNTFCLYQVNAKKSNLIQPLIFMTHLAQQIMFALMESTGMTLLPNC